MTLCFGCEEEFVPDARTLTVDASEHDGRHAPCAHAFCLSCTTRIWAAVDARFDEVRRGREHLFKEEVDA